MVTETKMRAAKRKQGPIPKVSKSKKVDSAINSAKEGGNSSEISNLNSQLKILQQKNDLLQA